MTITDLKRYAERMEAQLLPTDKLKVVLNREAVVYITAFLNDRHKSLTQAINDPKTSDKKRRKRKYELDLITSARAALDEAEMV